MQTIPLTTPQLLDLLSRIAFYWTRGAACNPSRALLVQARLVSGGR